MLRYVSVVVPLPAGLALNGNTMTWALPPIPVGGTVQISFRVTVRADAEGATVVNLAAPTSTGGHCSHAGPRTRSGSGPSCRPTRRPRRRDRGSARRAPTPAHRCAGPWPSWPAASCCSRSPVPADVSGPCGSRVRRQLARRIGPGRGPTAPGQVWISSTREQLAEPLPTWRDAPARLDGLTVAVGERFRTEEWREPWLHRASPRAKPKGRRGRQPARPAVADPRPSSADVGRGGETHQVATGPSDRLTTQQGAPVADDQNTLRLGERGPALLEDFHFREKIFHFDHERIPERVVHARGYGAHGFFETYESLADITRADIFQRAGERTPAFVRFSTVAGSKGSSDLARDVRGFAVKLYTQEGNWDLVGNNIPVFFIQDADQVPGRHPRREAGAGSRVPAGAVGSRQLLGLRVADAGVDAHVDVGHVGSGDPAVVPVHGGLRRPHVPAARRRR